MPQSPKHVCASQTAALKYLYNMEHKMSDSNSSPKAADLAEKELSVLLEEHNESIDINDRLEPPGSPLYAKFLSLSLAQLEELLLSAPTADEKAFYRALVNVRLTVVQQKIIEKPFIDIR